MELRTLPNELLLEQIQAMCTCTALGCMPQMTATVELVKSIFVGGGKALSWSGVHRHTATLRERRGEALRLLDCSSSLIELVDEDWERDICGGGGGGVAIMLYLHCGIYVM